jgi:hypothetical protein
LPEGTVSVEKVRWHRFEIAEPKVSFLALNVEGQDRSLVHLMSSTAKLTTSVVKPTVTAMSDCAFFLSSSRSIASQPASLRVLA